MQPTFKSLTNTIKKTTSEPEKNLYPPMVHLGLQKQANIKLVLQFLIYFNFYHITLLLTLNTLPPRSDS